jgi:hypothetical protein
MTWPDFWWDVASNTIATFLGVLMGIPAALAVERLLERRSEAKGRRAADARQREAVRLVARTLERNIQGVESLQRAIAAGETNLTPQLDATTWNVLRHELSGLPIELLADLSLVFNRVEELRGVQARYEDQFFTAAAALPSAAEAKRALQGVLIELCGRYRVVGERLRRQLTRFE